MNVGPKTRTPRGSAPGLLRDAARDVFAERGYHATTREIADRAGVSHELIFRYFDNKEKLFFEAVANPLLDAIEGFRNRWLDDLAEPGTDAVDHIRRFITAFYTFLSDNQPIAYAMVHLFSEPSTGDELQRLRERINTTVEGMMAPMNEYLAARGTSTSSTGLRLRIMMLLTGVVASFLTHTYATDYEVPPQEQIIDELTRLIHDMWLGGD